MDRGPYDPVDEDQNDNGGEDSGDDAVAREEVPLGTDSVVPMET